MHFLRAETCFTTVQVRAISCSGSASKSALHLRAEQWSRGQSLLFLDSREASRLITRPARVSVPSLNTNWNPSCPSADVPERLAGCRRGFVVAALAVKND